MEDKNTMQELQVDSGVKVQGAQKEEFLNQVIEAEKSAWPPELQATRQKFESRLKLFPQGFVIVRDNGKIKGVSTSQITTYDPNSSRTWDEITDDGMIEKTHNPQGDSLYVVSVGVSANAQGKGIGGVLVKSQIELARKLGLKYLFLGARVPGYDAYCRQNGDMSMEDYLKVKNEKGDTFDPEIRFYERQGLHPAKIIPNFEPDRQSRDFGVVMLWENKS